MTITQKRTGQISGISVELTRLIGIMLFFIPLFNSIFMQESFGESEGFLRLIELELFAVYILAFYLSIKSRGLYGLETLFLFTLGFFSLFGVFFSFIGERSYRETIINILEFSWKTNTSIHVLNYYLAFLCIFIIFIGKREAKTIPKYCFEHTDNAEDRFIRRWAGRFFILSVPFVLIYRISAVLFYSSVGRTAMYAGAGRLSGTLNQILLAFVYLYDISFFFICATEKSVKKFERISYIYLVLSLIPLLQGDRAEAVCAILFFIFFRYRVFGKKAKFGRLFIFGSVFIVILAVVGVARQGGRFDFTHLISGVQSFFLSSADSLNRAAYYYQNRAVMDYNTYPYIFDPLIRVVMVILQPGVFSGGQSDLSLKYRMSFSHHITYAVNPENYYNGGGLGGNFIAEMSEFGFWGVVFFSVIFMLIFEIYESAFCTVSVIKSQILCIL